MAKTLYLINPRPSSPSYFGAEAYEHHGYPMAQAIADLATTTVAALAPSDWTVTICEEYVEPIDFDADADFIGVTGKVIQVQRMIEVADAFRRRGKTVLIGGPHASLSPESFRGHCDVLVIGELESIAEDFFADLERELDKVEFFRPEEKRGVMAVNLRNIFQRMLPSQQDMRTLHGVITAIAPCTE